MNFNEIVKHHWTPVLRPYNFKIVDDLAGSIDFDNGIFKIRIGYDYNITKDFIFLLCLKNELEFRCLSDNDLISVLKVPVGPFEKLSEDQVIEKYVSFFDSVFKNYGPQIFSVAGFNDLWNASVRKLTLKPW